jgi:hypothetical protein
VGGNKIIYKRALPLFLKYIKQNYFSFYKNNELNYIYSKNYKFLLFKNFIFKKYITVDKKNFFIFLI